jgi:hypothetical protein
MAAKVAQACFSWRRQHTTLSEGHVTSLQSRLQMLVTLKASKWAMTVSLILLCVALAYVHEEFERSASSAAIAVT